MKYSLSLLTVAIQLASNTALADEASQNNLVNEFETIVVVGTKTEQKLADVAGTISVITSDEIEKNVSTNMADLFKYDPSIQITGSQGRAQNLVVRGMGADRVLLIKDGMRMNEGYGANGQNDVVGRGFIDVSTLKQVEVAKGAASSLYGSDALGGIVVFTTKSASDYLTDGESMATHINSLYAEKGKQMGLGATLAVRSGENEHLLNISYRDGESPQNYAASLSPLTLDSKSFVYKFDRQLTDYSKMSFSGDVWRQNSQGNSADNLLSHFRGLAQFGYQVTAENYSGEQKSDALKLAFTTEQGAWYDKLNTFIYYNNSEKFTEEYGQLDIDAPMFGVKELRDMYQRGLFKQTTKGIKLHANKQFDLAQISHEFGYGFDLESSNTLRTVNDYRIADGTVSRDTTTAKFPENDILRAGFYLNDTIELLDAKLSLIPSLRWDYYDMDPNDAKKADGSKYKAISDNNISFNFASLYKLTEQVNVYAQYGQGFKVPPYDLAYIEHLNAFPGYTYHLIPSEQLKPEQSDTYELGIRGQLDNFAFTGALFYNQYDQFITTKLLSSEMLMDDAGDVSGVKDTFQYQNIENVVIKGAELGINYYLGDSITLFANASYQDGKDQQTKQYISSISPLSGNAGVSFEQQNYQLDLTLNWAKQMTKVNQEQYQTPGFATLDMSAQYQFTAQLKINLVVNNLLDKQYLLHQNSQGHNKNDDLSTRTELGRHAAVNLSYQF